MRPRGPGNEDGVDCEEMSSSSNADVEVTAQFHIHSPICSESFFYVSIYTSPYSKNSMKYLREIC